MTTHKYVSNVLSTGRSASSRTVRPGGRPPRRKDLYLGDGPKIHERRRSERRKRERLTEEIKRFYL